MFVFLNLIEREDDLFSDLCVLCACDIFRDPLQSDFGYDEFFASLILLLYLHQWRTTNFERQLSAGSLARC